MQEVPESALRQETEQAQEALVQVPVRERESAQQQAQSLAHRREVLALGEEEVTEAYLQSNQAWPGQQH